MSIPPVRTIKRSGIMKPNSAPEIPRTLATIPTQGLFMSHPAIHIKTNELSWDLLVTKF